MAQHLAKLVGEAASLGFYELAIEIADDITRDEKSRTAAAKTIAQSLVRNKKLPYQYAKELLRRVKLISPRLHALRVTRTYWPKRKSY